MKLKTKYILFVGVLHLVCLLMSYFIFEENRWIFMVAEVFILISIVLSIKLYNQLIKPLTYLSRGIQAIKDKDFNVKFLTTGKSEVDELVDVYNRMIDELRAERTRQQEQHFFLEKLIQTSSTGIIILDYDGKITQINSKAEEVLASAPDLLDQQIAAMSAGSSKLFRIDGLHTYKIQKSAFIDRGFGRIFVMMEEVTSEIFHAEKNVYSKVIRMMAHEVNNTIGPVNSIINSALSQADLWKGDGADALKKAMQVAVDRNQNLNLFMRNFADLVKLPVPNRRQIDLVVLLKKVAELMHFLTNGKSLLFEFDLPQDPCMVMADIGQMEQALINIVKNSIEAIEGQGVIRFSLDPGARKLIISDNGKGISEEHAGDLFNPFFSTKKEGQGIGLTLVREILLNHGFAFSLKTIGPGNTRFSISLGSEGGVSG